MKICGIICEFNPFHNGHAHIISEAKRLSGCDLLLCIMSGQFTQRGEMCRTDKYLRAKHAVLAGADAVAELPAPFAVAPAEIFAKGAVKLFGEIDADKTLCFGCESGSAEDFVATARALSAEGENFKRMLAEGLDCGMSYIRSYSAAFGACGGDQKLISFPNNILGVEYCKAALACGKDVKIITIPRACGNAYAPAHTIRERAESPNEIKAFMPDYSYADFCASDDRAARFKQACADGVYFADKDSLKRIYGCTEGLENRLKKLTAELCGDYDGIIARAVNKRYSAARIRRIMTANLLGLYADDTAEFLKADLPLKVLAIRRQCADKLLPLLSRHTEQSADAARCCELNSAAYSLWRYLSRNESYSNPNEKMILI